MLEVRMNSYPKITFGIIVLNGEPFTRYCLRSLYPFAHEIIVVEGASEKAAAIATPDGHSIDGTLDILHNFKAKEDPANKLTVVTAEDHGHPNGFWPGEKDEQSRAYAERATGDYFWQVDIDEFYRSEDIHAVLTMLANDSCISGISFYWKNFWGGFKYLVNGVFLEQHYMALGGVARLFKWGPGYRYITHRPPTVEDANGVDARDKNWIRGDDLVRRGVYCYHYSTVFPDSVRRKMQYYSQQNWKKHDRLCEWYRCNFERIHHPFRVHHVVEEISWISRFKGTHPPEIQRLISDLSNDELGVRLRSTNDIERLLSTRRYLLGAFCFRILTPFLLKLKKRFPRRETSLKRLIEGIFSPAMFYECSELQRK